MKIALALLLTGFLGGCGHMAPYSEKPLGYVELYDGVQHRYQLRIPYEITLYQPFPSQSYISSEWITLDGSASDLSSETSEALPCPEGTTTSASRYQVRGRVVVGTSTAKVQMEDLRKRDSGVADWGPYRFNGEYRLVRGQQPPGQVAQAEAEAAAQAFNSSFTNYRCEPVFTPGKQ